MRNDVIVVQSMSSKLSEDQIAPKKAFPSAFKKNVYHNTFVQQLRMLKYNYHNPNSISNDINNIEAEAMKDPDRTKDIATMNQNDLLNLGGKVYAFPAVPILLAYSTKFKIQRRLKCIEEYTQILF
jgi:hypothetical protein